MTAGIIFLVLVLLCIFGVKGMIRRILLHPGKRGKNQGRGRKR